MPVKILVLSNYTDTHTMRPEAEAFINLKQNGFEITIMTESGSFYYNKFIEEGIKVIDFLPKKKNDKNEIKIIRDELLRGNYDAMHLFNNKAVVNGIAAAKNFPLRLSFIEVILEMLIGGIQLHIRKCYIQGLTR